MAVSWLGADLAKQVDILTLHAATESLEPVASTTEISVEGLNMKQEKDIGYRCQWFPFYTTRPNFFLGTRLFDIEFPLCSRPGEITDDSGEYEGLIQ